MELLDTISIGILLGAVLVLAGILSSLVALRFGAPLLFVFLLVGMLAGDSGIGGIQFADVRLTYIVGSIALAIILFDGGIRTRFAVIRNVLGPAAVLATLGVLVTAAVTAPVAMVLLNMSWTEGLLLGAVVASTDAAAVFFLLHARGLRLRPRVSGTLEVESGTNDPFAVFLTIVLIEVLLIGNQPWQHVAWSLLRDSIVGAAIGLIGGNAIVFVLNRLALPQGLHGPFVTVGAVVIFAIAAAVPSSGFLAAYLAGLVVGNRTTRAHNTVVVFLDAITWLSQIGMFVLLGLLAWPNRLGGSLAAALVISATLMLIARPVAVWLCLIPFRFTWREKTFISWVGLRGAVGIFLASIPLLVGLPKAFVYFDVAFVVVLTSLLIQGWTIAPAARWLDVAFARADPLPRRVELDLPGQLEQEIVGYPVRTNSPYLRRGLLPNWARPTLIVRDERILMPAEAGSVREGDYVYLLAPPEKAQALDRFFVDTPAPARPDPRLLGDFFVSGDVQLGALVELYGLTIAPEHTTTTLADYFYSELSRPPRKGDALPLGPIALVAHTVANERVTMVGLRLADDEDGAGGPFLERAKRMARRLLERVRSFS
jgi:cell volume regulation protein A